tara:strand:- start:125 stop:328 length:204 start_codon:yes stop_codon:yes gene_type:complete
MVCQIEASCPVQHRTRSFLQNNPQMRSVDEELPDQIFMGMIECDVPNSISSSKVKQVASFRSDLLDG